MYVIEKVFNRKIYQFLLVLMMGISIFPLILCGVAIYENINSSFFNQSITASKQHSEEWGKSVNSIFEQGIEDMISLGHSPSIYSATMNGLSLDKTSLYVTYEGTKFGAADSNDNLPNKEALSWDPNNNIYPDASNYLEQYVTDHSEYVEIFVTDMRGIL